MVYVYISYKEHEEVGSFEFDQVDLYIKDVHVYVLIPDIFRKYSKSFAASFIRRKKAKRTVQELQNCRQTMNRQTTPPPQKQQQVNY